MTKNHMQDFADKQPKQDAPHKKQRQIIISLSLTAEELVVLVVGIVLLVALFMH